MKNFSKYALTSITALTVASPFVTMDGHAKDKSVKPVSYTHLTLPTNREV